MRVTRCPKCNLLNPTARDICDQCGAPLHEALDQPVGPQPGNQGWAGNPPSVPAPSPARRILSFILAAIVGAFTGLVVTGAVCIPIWIWAQAASLPMSMVTPFFITMGILGVLTGAVSGTLRWGWIYGISAYGLSLLIFYVHARTSVAYIIMPQPWYPALATVCSCFMSYSAGRGILNRCIAGKKSPVSVPAPNQGSESIWTRELDHRITGPIRCLPILILFVMRLVTDGIRDSEFAQDPSCFVMHYLWATYERGDLSKEDEFLIYGLAYSVAQNPRLRESLQPPVARTADRSLAIQDCIGMMNKASSLPVRQIENKDRMEDRYYWEVDVPMSPDGRILDVYGSAPFDSPLAITYYVRKVDGKWCIAGVKCSDPELQMH